MLLDWRVHKALAFGVYESAVVETVCRIVRRGWQVADVGAHVGYYSLLFRKIVGPEGRVFAFEPLEDNFIILQRNMALNGYSDVIVENMAIDDIEGTATLQRGTADPTSPIAALSAVGEVTVRTTTLDSYFGEETALSLVKIDVEGSEDRVLRGMRNVLARQRPILILELHDDVSGERTRSLLYEFDYESTPITDSLIGHYHVLALPRETSAKGYVDTPATNG